MVVVEELDPIKYNYWIGLLGFFKEIEASQVAANFDPEKHYNQSEFQRELNEAIEYVKGISGRQDMEPEVNEVNSSERTIKLKSDPTYKEHINGMTSDKIALVELEKLHCFQPFLNEEYVNKLVEKTPDIGDSEGLMKFCLPLREEQTKNLVNASFNGTTNTYSLVTENLDFRVLGNVQGQDNNSGRHFCGFAYGGGLPQMSAVKYGGITMIKNGYHRAYALYLKGHKFAPFILMETPSFQFTGATLPGFFPIELLQSNRAPLLSDFKSKAAVKLPRKRIRAVISIHAELQFLTV
jgi:hypothetical protein